MPVETKAVEVHSFKDERKRPIYNVKTTRSTMLQRSGEQDAFDRQRELGERFLHEFNGAETNDERAKALSNCLEVVLGLLNTLHKETTDNKRGINNLGSYPGNY